MGFRPIWRGLSAQRGRANAARGGVLGGVGASARGGGEDQWRRRAVIK